MQIQSVKNNSDTILKNTKTKKKSNRECDNYRDLNMISFKQSIEHLNSFYISKKEINHTTLQCSYSDYKYCMVVMLTH